MGADRNLCTDQCPVFQIVWRTEGWLSEEDRCILFDDDRNDLYEYFYVFPDYTDQPLVLGSAADG